jgi:hypothetical protein
MRSITIELPDKIASLLESMPESNRNNALLLAALLGSAREITLDELCARIDERVRRLGLTDADIEALVNEIS